MELAVGFVLARMVAAAVVQVEEVKAVAVVAGKLQEQEVRHKGLAEVLR